MHAQEQLARELQRRKNNEERDRREIQRVCGESEELRELQQRLQMAYINKERTAQIRETHHIREQDAIEDVVLDQHMMQKRKAELVQEARFQEQKRIAAIENKNVMKDQMLEKERARAEAYQEYVKDREAVDGVINKIMEEDRRAWEYNNVKKDQALEAMAESHERKQQIIQVQKQMEEAEILSMKRYQEEQDQRDREIAEQKAAVVEKQNEIFAQLDKEERRRRAEQEYVERLRNELYFEEFEASEQEKERKRAEEQARITEELMIANEYQAQLKAQRRQQEEAEEIEFRNKMLQKFAEDDRLDQMNEQRRRMRELEHKRNADMLWREKQEMLRMQRAQEDEERIKVMLDERRKAEIIERERQRLLKEHAAVVNDYLPKGTLKNDHDKELVYGVRYS